MSEKYRLMFEPARPGADGILLFAGGADELLAGLRGALDAAGAPPCRLSAFDAADWDADYTPWPLDAPNGRRFAGGADMLLPSVESAVEQLRLEGAQRVFLVGYSLGGLASLYFHTRLSTDGAASCSGSIWYPGFVDYLCGHPPRGAIYFSIGGKEKNTRDELMRLNEPLTQQAYDLCRMTTERTVFNHEPGGHFRDIHGRLSRAIIWLIKTHL